jgi:uncharacterized integral membrane protein
VDREHEDEHDANPLGLALIAALIMAIVIAVMVGYSR